MKIYIKKLIKGMLMSFSMFSTIPVPSIWEESSLCYIIPMFPLVGMVIGVFWYFTAMVLTWTKLPLMLISSVVMLVPLFLTGFIHMDGYMDTSDAIFSRGSLEKKRSILKDSHVGAFAVIALSVFMLLMFSGIYIVIEKTEQFSPLILIPVLSRCISGLTLLNAKQMSTQGLGASFRKDTKPVHSAFLVLLTCLIFLLGGILGGVMLMIVFIVESIVGFLFGKYTIKQLDGISGDLCGFILTVTELAAVLAWAVILYY